RSPPADDRENPTPRRRPFEDQPTMSPPSRSSRRFTLVAPLVALALVGAEAAPVSPPDGPALLPSDPSGCSPEQLDQLFSGGRVGDLPVGLGRGRILVRVDGKLPRLRAKLGGLAWKGKYFHPDGSFTNQWAGFRAISSHVAVGPSWY